MFHRLLLSLLGLFCFTFAIFSQNLPIEMRLSTDGRQLLTGGRVTTGFYDESVIREVNFQFAQPDYWTLLTNNYKAKIPILATMTVDGEIFDSVGIRFKGQTSYMGVSSQKKSFAVELDFVKSKQDVMGYETLNFNNCFLDPSFIREVLYSYTRSYVEVVNNTPARTVVYAPKGAEHDVFIYRVQPDLNSAAEVVINEIMASNSVTAADPNGEFDDWIELFNKGNQAADMGGWSLSDDPLKPEKWKFPAGTTLPAGGYLIVWCDENGMQPGLHANFKLSGSGETIWLRNPAGTVIQEIVFGQQTTDKGFARVPNGTGNFVIQNPSFNANNNTVGTEDALDNTAVWEIFPNPTTGQITVKTNTQCAENLAIFALTGIKIWEGKVLGRSVIDLSDLPAGVYFVKMRGGTQRLVIL